MGRAVLSPPAVFYQRNNKVAMGFSLLFFSCSLDSSTQKGIRPWVCPDSFHGGINAGLFQLVLLYSFSTHASAFHGWLVF